jgi:serine/threonine protein kinase
MFDVVADCRHPHVLRLFTYFHDSKRIILALEFANKGELFKHLQREGKFDDKRSSRVSVFIVLGSPAVHGLGQLYSY